MRARRPRVAGRPNPFFVIDSTSNDLNIGLPSSTLYVDFGDNFPVGGFDLTDLQLRSDFSAGGLQGPNLSFSDATLYRFLPASQRVTFDYNGSGTVNAQDWIDLRTTAMSLVQRYYARSM